MTSGRQFSSFFFLKVAYTQFRANIITMVFKMSLNFLKKDFSKEKKMKNNKISVYFDSRFVNLHLILCFYNVI